MHSSITHTPSASMYSVTLTTLTPSPPYDLAFRHATMRTDTIGKHAIHDAAESY
jgi:hypothetical protein